VISGSSLEVDLLFVVEASVDRAHRNHSIAARLVNCKGKVRGSVSEVEANLALPLGETFALIDEIVVGLEACLNLGEGVLNVNTLGVAVDVHRDGGVVSIDAGLQNVHDVVQVRRVLKDAVDLLVVVNRVLGLLQVCLLLSAAALGVVLPVFLKFLKSKHRLNEGSVTLLVVLSKLMEGALDELSLESCRLAGLQVQLLPLDMSEHAEDSIPHQTSVHF
jgi:hypothetical protein